MSLFLLLITITIPSAWGVFDGRGGPRPGDQFLVTGDLLQCFGDNGPIVVGLNITNPGDVFKPLRSRYRYPEVLNDFNQFFFAGVSILSKLNINRDYQSLFRPPNFNITPVAAFPLRYPPRSDDLPALQQICGNDVIARLNSSNRNADQPYFEDIMQMLQTEWLHIYGNLSMDDRERIASSEGDSVATFEETWKTEQTEDFFSALIQALSCRVAFRWADAGPTYIPRYYFGGYCLNRNCSVPDRDEFRCHADLSPEESRFLEAARWDCCWTYREGFKYQCGFRKVNFQIVCDCDCRCQDKAGTK